METFIVQNWNKYLNDYPPEQKDIYFTEEYVKLYESEVDKALCAVCTDNIRTMIFPFLRRTCALGVDFETAYGYGGPISNTNDYEWNNKALERIGKLFKNEGYVCGFIRFHPIINNQDICHKEMRVFFDRPTVSIDLRHSEEDIWKSQIISKNRNMIRKAEKNDLVYAAEYDFASVDDFIKLYLDTMKRIGADDFYCFDKSYFYRFAEVFKGRSFLGTVRKDGLMICAAMFMYSKRYGHYHLEGSNHNYSSLGANNFLLWKTALELKKNGVEEFHLGGGYNSDSENSLLKFKKSFSSNLKNFYIGKWIFDEEKYIKIKENWRVMNPLSASKYSQLLLCYRFMD